MKTHGRRIAIGAGIITAMVLGVAAYVARDRIAEEWYLRKLDSPDFTEKFRAALKLGELRSIKAIPKLANLMKEADHHSEEAWAAWQIPADFRPGGLMAHVFEQIGPTAGPALINLLKGDPNSSHEWKGYACVVIKRLKIKAAIPQLVCALNVDDNFIKIMACDALGELGDKSVIPALKQAVKDNEEHKPVKISAERALGQLEADYSASP